MKFKSLAIVAAMALTTALAGCTTDGSALFTNSYGAKRDAGYQLPAIPVYKVPREYRRQVVTYRTDEAPGTVIVDTGTKHLYFVMPNGKAMRYGIGVGREGFEWSGTNRITRKAEWPGWTPPPAMRKRQPDLPGHMPGGPDNPLGARALYLYEGDQDTIYRIHGTPEPWTIGLDVSSGCIRMNNDDITDLHSRIQVGAKVIVLMQGAALYKGV